MAIATNAVAVVRYPMTPRVVPTVVAEEKITWTDGEYSVIRTNGRPHVVKLDPPTPAVGAAA